MKLLASGPEKVNLKQLIQDQVQGDYIYMYPPRQSYYPLDEHDLASHIRDSLKETRAQPVNVYLHFPFCRQICAFCNLYSVSVRPNEQFAEYVDLITREIELWSPLIAGRAVDTIYLGGGTPSLLPVSELDRCLRSLENALGMSRYEVSEVAIEVAPDTVDEIKLSDMQGIGITRVNLGLQTTSDEGLHQIGRRHGFALARKRIEDALSSGFKNVCIDLIYGLPQQTVNDWRAIVIDVLELGAPTICAYPLTVRPNTAFGRKSINLLGSEQYVKYETARDLLGEAGYAQETHVRYIVPGRGGYRQKQNHWAGQDIIGIGAGARGYLRNCDYRNGYSIRRRRDALELYASRMRSGQWPFTAGFYLNEAERMRRQVVLGLFDFDRVLFKDEFGGDVEKVFANEFNDLSALDLIDINTETIRLTKKGRKYRDLIAQLFFSGEVWQRISDFSYME
jgi:oxygen-independent coproporphyrinogen III oxidase